MKSALLLWSLTAALALGADVPNVEQPSPEANDAVLQAQPERKARKRPVPGRHRQDLIGIGATTELKAGESCGDLVVIGGSATVDGQVLGDVVIIGSTAKLGPAAEVNGDTVIIGSLLDTDPAATLHHSPVLIGSLGGTSNAWWVRWPMEWVSKGLLWGRPLPHQFAWSWTLAGIFLVLYIGTALLFPRPVQACVRVLEDQPGSAFLAGLLAFGLFVPVLLLLVVSLVGLVVVPFYVVSFVGAFLFGKVVVYSYAGQKLGAQLGLGAFQKPLLALLSGVLLFYGCYTVPVLGLIVWGAAASLAIGSVTLVMARRFRSSQTSPPCSAAVAVMMEPTGAAGAGAIPAEPKVLMLPRVGFWLRLLATGIDAAVVILVLGNLARVALGRSVHLGEWIPLIWTVYHVAMWAWRGTTIGGLVFGLKIVRTDGRPISFGVALIRSLAAFLSAAVLFLGFFWAGWTSTRQAWHDKIAGTVIVKMPRGVSALT